MKKILLFHFTDKFLLKISKELKRKSHIILVGDYEDNKTYKDSYNTFLSDQSFQLYNLHKFSGGNGIITNEYISKFTDLENLFYRLIDRVAVRPLPTIQKRSFYLEILKYWKNFFENNEIDKVIFVSYIPIKKLYHILLQKI